MTDLFHDPNPAEEAYAAALAHQAKVDRETIMAQGRVPAHIELDSILQKDEFRLLDLIEEHGGYVMGDDRLVSGASSNLGLFRANAMRKVDSLTADCGFLSPGNCQATVNRCKAEGWITEGIDVSGRVRYDLTRMGRYAKSLYEYEMSWEEDE